MKIPDIIKKAVEVVLEEREVEGMQPFTIKGMTSAQYEAIKDVAFNQGYKDLRGYHMYLKSWDLEYYNIIKKAYE